MALAPLVSTAQACHLPLLRHLLMSRGAREPGEDDAGMAHTQPWPTDYKAGDRASAGDRPRTGACMAWEIRRPEARMSASGVCGGVWKLGSCIKVAPSTLLQCTHPSRHPRANNDVLSFCLDPLGFMPCQQPWSRHLISLLKRAAAVLRPLGFRSCL